MKIVCWNIRQGGGSRITKIFKALIQSNADLIQLSEYRHHSKGQWLLKSLAENGYEYQAVSNENTPNTHGVLIASRYPVTFQNMDPSIPYHEGILVASSDLIHFIGVYFPHKKKHELFEVIRSYYLESEIPFVLGGDFNTGINYIDQKGNSFWYQSQWMRLIQDGYLDAYRFFHEKERCYSWYSHAGNGYRYDHIWIHRNLARDLKACEYNHQVRKDGLSDHSLQYIILEF